MYKFYQVNANLISGSICRLLYYTKLIVSHQKLNKECNDILKSEAAFLMKQSSVN